MPLRTMSHATNAEMTMPVAKGRTIARNPRMIITTDHPMDIPVTSLNTLVVLCSMMILLFSATWDVRCMRFRFLQRNKLERLGFQPAVGARILPGSRDS
jgi:hypothetical protein